ncbi:hypothetical protein B7494_g5066 [Chlorociboria aeruginascens]|nr:hypothetical protein B7494_g5066 [Chlorociboria aeruginascens]
MVRFPRKWSLEYKVYIKSDPIISLSFLSFTYISRSMFNISQLHIGDNSKKPHVGIVGAGIAGLRCADVLLQNGFKVTILEGRDRIGGRTHQTTLPSGQILDLGANWIHGTEHNAILDIAREVKSPNHTWEESGHVFDEDGNLLENGKELEEMLWGMIVEAFQHSNENSSTIDASKSLFDFLEKKVNETYPEDEKRRKFLLQAAEMWGGFVGTHITRQSLKFFWLEECIDGENIFVAGTYKNIIARIAKAALEKADMKLSTKVERVEKVTGGVIVHTEGSERLIFDEVIITFPKAFWLGDTTNPNNEPFTGMAQWLSPKYGSEANPERWNQECVELGTLPGRYAHPSLLFYTYGSQSRSFTADLAALPSQKARDEHIINFFKPYYSLLPNYSEHSPNCKPCSCIATDWCQDEFSGYGSYTNFQVGLQEGDQDVEVLRQGLPGRNIWFAGEHTAPFIALGTTTGAYQSGDSVGKMIVEGYGMVGQNEMSPVGEINGRSKIQGSMKL